MSGRRAAAPAPGRPGVRVGNGLPGGGLITLPRLARVVIGIGAVLILIGLATWLLGGGTGPRTLTLDGAAPVALRPGALGADTPVTVHVRAAGATAFIGVARDGDAAAVLDGSAWVEPTGAGEDEVVRHDGARALTDPRASDVWVSLAAQPDEVTLTWPVTEGDWRIVASTIGRAPSGPGAVELRWTGPAERGGRGWMRAGGLAVIAGAAGVAWGRRGSGRSGWSWQIGDGGPAAAPAQRADDESPRAGRGPVQGPDQGPVQGAEPDAERTGLISRRALRDLERSHAADATAMISRRAIRDAEPTPASQARPPDASPPSQPPAPAPASAPEPDAARAPAPHPAPAAPWFQAEPSPDDPDPDEPEQDEPGPAPRPFRGGGS